MHVRKNVGKGREGNVGYLVHRHDAVNACCVCGAGGGGLVLVIWWGQIYSQCGSLSDTFEGVETRARQKARKKTWCDFA